VNYSTELVWLAAALAFLGSFGLGCTAEQIMRKQRAMKASEKEDAE